MAEIGESLLVVETLSKIELGSSTEGSIEGDGEEGESDGICVWDKDEQSSEEVAEQRRSEVIAEGVVIEGAAGRWVGDGQHVHGHRQGLDSYDFLWGGAIYK